MVNRCVAHLAHSSELETPTFLSVTKFCWWRRVTSHAVSAVSEILHDYQHVIFGLFRDFVGAETPVYER